MRRGHRRSAWRGRRRTPWRARGPARKPALLAALVGEVGACGGHGLLFLDALDAAVEAAGVHNGFGLGKERKWMTNQ